MSELIDNRANRIRALKRIIKRLHGGADPADVKRELTRIVGETDASEIAAMEQELMADGMPVDEVRSMCDLHAEVLNEVVKEPTAILVPPGHPVDTFRKENDALQEAVAAMRVAMVAIRKLGEADSPGDALTRWRQSLNDLMDVEKHYQRKENLLFSCLERHGVTGPSKVMWAKDDEVRELLNTLGEALAVEDASAGEFAIVADQVAEPALRAVEGMVFKEENILLPMALQTLTEDEWGEIWRQAGH